MGNTIKQFGFVPKSLGEGIFWSGDPKYIKAVYEELREKYSEERIENAERSNACGCPSCVASYLKWEDAQKDKI